MVLSFKYHIFTITAIFAALGIGILIGTSLLGNEVLINEQKELINNIDHDITKISNENTVLKNDIQSLRSEVSYRKDIEKQMLSMLSVNKMSDKKYTLITSNKHELKELKEIMAVTGAELDIISGLSVLPSIILVETHPEFDSATSDVDNALLEQGYTITDKKEDLETGHIIVAKRD